MKSFQAFIDKGLIKKDKIDISQAVKVLEKSHRCIKSAMTLLKDGDPEGSYQLAYEAMLLAGRALIFSLSFRPRSVGSHKIVADFTKTALGELKNLYKPKIRKRNFFNPGALGNASIA